MACAAFARRLLSSSRPWVCPTWSRRATRLTGENPLFRCAKSASSGGGFGRPMLAPAKKIGLGRMPSDGFRRARKLSRRGREMAPEKLHRARICSQLSRQRMERHSASGGRYQFNGYRSGELTSNAIYGVTVDARKTWALDFKLGQRAFETIGFAAELHARSNFSTPSFSIELSILSPDFSHTCFSFGMPRITPDGVPVKMMSPGSNAKSLDM